MHALHVGKLFRPGRTFWPPGVTYSYRAGYHDLLLFFSSPRKEEVEAVRKGRAVFALYVEGLVIFLLYRFAPAISWGDAPYSWHLLPPAEQQRPEEVPGGQALLHTTLVDADTGRSARRPPRRGQGGRRMTPPSRPSTRALRPKSPWPARPIAPKGAPEARTLTPPEEEAMHLAQRKSELDEKLAWFQARVFPWMCSVSVVSGGLQVEISFDRAAAGAQAVARWLGEGE